MKIKPLHEILKAYNKFYPFHMPGHKRNPKFIHRDFLSLDLTELAETDNLHQPTGAIDRLQKKYAEIYRADSAYISVNGATVGILAAITYACKPCEKILMAGNSHKSAYSGLILSGATPLYVYPEILPNGLEGGINPKHLEALLSTEKDIAAVYITSPTYTGLCSDIRETANLCRKYNKLLIVDQAHGAHFGLDPIFPDSAIQQGADIVIISLHKTLPTYGQSALILTSKRVDKNRLSQALNLVQTTSPSYGLMGTLSFFADFLTSTKSRICFDKYAQLINHAYRELSSCKKIRILGNEYNGSFSVYEKDISKIVLLTNPKEMTGKLLEELLIKSHKLLPEMSAHNYVLAITGIADTSKGIKRLIKAVKQTDTTLKLPPESGCRPEFSFIPTKQILTPREAFYLPCKYVPLQASVGKVSAGKVIPYPPGVPILSVGEEITQTKINQIQGYINQGTYLLGINDRKLQVVDS